MPGFALMSLGVLWGVMAPSGSETVTANDRQVPDSEAAPEGNEGQPIAELLLGGNEADVLTESDVILRQRLE